jgi:4-amino-4-deoxy-L-arabinose transferase-like glycosyltransferase
MAQSRNKRNQRGKKRPAAARPRASAPRALPTPNSKTASGQSGLIAIYVIAGLPILINALSKGAISHHLGGRLLIAAAALLLAISGLVSLGRADSPESTRVARIAVAVGVVFILYAAFVLIRQR